MHLLVQGLPAFSSTWLCGGASAFPSDAFCLSGFLVHAHSPIYEDQEGCDCCPESFESCSPAFNCVELFCGDGGAIAFAAMGVRDLLARAATSLSKHEWKCNAQNVCEPYRSYSSCNLFRRCSLNSPSKVAMPIETPMPTAAARGRIRPAILSRNNSRSVLSGNSVN